MARATLWLQISFNASAVAVGTAAVWLAVTFLFGRVYCATVCPVGTFCDIFLRARIHFRKLNRPFAYREPGKWGMKILLVFLVCVVAGVAVVTFTLEPLNMARNMAAVINRDAVEPTWATIAPGVTAGIITGVVTILVLAATSLRYGREFCTRWCPVGTALGRVQEYARWHIEFDPDRCTSCGLCEEQCRAQAIKVSARLVDERRCVRCLDCVADCPEGAIRYQPGRNRPATPLMRDAGSK